MQDNFLGFLGLIRKGGGIIAGDEAVTLAVQQGKGQLLLIAEDSAKRLQDRMASLAETCSVPKRILPYTKEQLGTALGKAPCGVLCIADWKVASAVLKKIDALASKAK